MTPPPVAPAADARAKALSSKPQPERRATATRRPPALRPLTPRPIAPLIVGDSPAGDAPVVVEAGLKGSTKQVGTKRSPGRRFAFDVVLGALFVALLQLFAVQVSVVRGQSMEPGLHDGDRIVVDRITYAWLDVSRFDVVVLSYPCDPDVDFVKRVVGLPGDLVQIRYGEVSVNGEPLHRDFQTVQDDASHGPVRVPSGAFFVLGDNRPVSCDSREFGLVQSPHVKGKVRLRFWPLSRFAIF